MPVGTLIYVASPYTDPDKQVQNERNRQVALAMGWLINHHPNLAFYSPICHAHPIASLCTLPGDWGFWQLQDKIMLSRCDEIWVLCIDGWNRSTGVTAELEIARSFGLPIKFIKPNLNNVSGLQGSQWYITEE